VIPRYDVRDLPRERLEELLSAMPSLRVAVVGDYSLDRYGAGEVSGVSRETGDRVNRLWWHAFNPGGAGNVAWNVADLGGQVRAICVIGDDEFGRILTNHLKRSAADTKRIVRDPGRITGSYEKLQVADQDGAKREVRLDVDNRNPITEESEFAVVNAVKVAMIECDAIIAADYNEEAMGILTARVTRAVCAAAERKDKLVAAISRTRPMNFAPAMLVVNEYEACHATGVCEPAIFDEVDEDTVARAGALIAERTGRPSFVTLGRRGMLVTGSAGGATVVPTRPPRGETDITGAGDSALAGIVLCLGAGASPAEAAAVGNLAAYVTIHKLNTTGTATPEEILREHAATVR